MTDEHLTAASTRHDTVRIERTFASAPERVFHAFADVACRVRWAVPAGERIEYLEADFAVGGLDVFRCGPPGDLSFQGEVRYEDIVAPQRIVFTETVSQHGRRLAVALVTMECTESKAGTHVILTAQIASFDGADMAGGYRHGWGAALGNLDVLLRADPSP